MPLLLLILVPAAFGLNPVIARALAHDIEPGTLSLVRWGLSTLLIGVIALARGRRERWRVPADVAAKLILLGALGFGFCSFAAYAGVRTATATTVGLVYACTSAIVMLVEILRGRVQPSLLLGLGLVACLTGVAVILTRGDLAAILQISIGTGELWAVAGTVVWAGYTAAMTRMPAVMTPLAQFTLMSFAGCLACLIPTLVELSVAGMPTVTPTIGLWVATLILIPSCGAFIGYNLSITRNGGLLTSASLSLVPLYIAGMAIVLINEDVRWYHGVAIVCVILGLGLINYDRSRAARA
jgi:drug/metabolite transporter (DMT)-like permease